MSNLHDLTPLTGKVGIKLDLRAKLLRRRSFGGGRLLILTFT